jgi:excisionase family DNA binding protein
MVYLSGTPPAHPPNIRSRMVKRDFVRLGANLVTSKTDATQNRAGFNVLDSTEFFVTASQAGDFLELHPATIQRFAREGLIPAHPVSGRKRRHWRFLRSELEEWLRARNGGRREFA